MTEELAYKIEQEVYRGPFDLLIQAVDAGEINVYNISLAQITASYFEYWKRMEPSFVLASDFLIMAAYLMELKSRSLLPAKEEIIIEEDQENLEGSLLAHIQEYQVFKNVAQTLKQRKEVFEKIYPRHEGEDQEAEFELTDVSLKDLLQAFQRMYQEAAKREKVVTIKDEEVTIEQRIEEIKDILAQNIEGVPFEKIFIRFTRMEIVVSFLAVLELAKQNAVRIVQGGKFSSITLFAKGEDNVGSTSTDTATTES